MNPEELEAFATSYASNIACYEKEEVKAFISHYCKEDVDQNEVYDKHPCYSSVLDAYLVWGDAVKYAKEQAK